MKQLDRAYALPALAALAVAVGCGDADERGDEESGQSGVLTIGGSSSGALTQGGPTGPDKLDVAQGTATGNTGGDCPGSGGGMDGEVEFSLIWIANSPEGTVSKIDTRTGQELGRYYTGPTNGSDDPSRTSVNLLGDVAVANRAGGLMKIAGREPQCVDANNDGAITTSTGPGNVLPFGEDECVLWHVPLPWPENDNRQGPRPTAWDAGTKTGECVNNDARVWTGWWEAATTTAFFRRFDGAAGAMLDEVVIPNYAPGNDWGYGPYGGAVDGDGNFWVTGLLGPLTRIDGETLDVQSWPLPAGAGPYGTTVDADGHVWTAGLNDGELTHFDPNTQMFDIYPTPNTRLRGLQIDRNGQLWAAGNEPCGLIQFDLATRTLVNGAIPLPGCINPVGISIDVDGFVWSPDQEANLAFKVDPNTYATTTTMGLVGPYTYSDMTGAGLGLVVNPPAG